jgi:D-alanyl-D-alanine carboxypeptidase
VIEAATGEPWEQALADRILEPLGLGGTSVPSTPDLPEPHLHGYAALPFADGWSDVTALHPSSLGAAAAVVSTPGDLDRFFESLLGGELVGPALLAEMTDGLPIEEGSDVRYGLGLARVPLSCGSGYFMHSGDTLGFHTRNGVTERGDRSVAIAISADGDFEAQAGALIDRGLCP